MCDGPLLTAEVLLSVTPTRINRRAPEALGMLAGDARMETAVSEGCRNFPFALLGLPPVAFAWKGSEPAALQILGRN